MSIFDDMFGRFAGIMKFLTEGISGEIIEKPKGSIIVFVSCADGVETGIDDGVCNIGVEECFGFFRLSAWFSGVSTLS